MTADSTGRLSGISDTGPKDSRASRPPRRAFPNVSWHDPDMVRQFLAMPGGVRLFLVYALAILFGIGISLRYVIDQAIGAPVSGPGVVVMVLLAYTIFTTTLVLQRKEAARTLAIGLASLTLPLIPFLLVNGLLPQGLVLSAFALALLHGLMRPSVRAWLNQP